MAVGMKVMVTENLDITNGSRGDIISIILNARESPLPNDPIVHLQYLPAYILAIVELEHTRILRLEGLRTE